MIDMTAFKITTFADLIQLIKQNAELRYELREALDLDNSFKELRQSLNRLAQAQAETQEEFKKLAEGQQLMQKLLTELMQRVDRVEIRLDTLEIRMEYGFAEAAADRHAIRDRMEYGFAEAAADRHAMKHTLGILKGKTYERELSDRAAGVFGRYIRRGHNAAIELSDIIQNAEEAGKITEIEYDHIYAADLLWAGKLKTTNEDIVLVIEASWLVLATDLDRAITRADILRKAGIKTLPVIAGVEWDNGIADLALAQGVVMVLDRGIDKSSWLSALEHVS